MTSPSVDTALRYLAAGLSVIPCRRGDKRPDSHLLPRDDQGRATWIPFQQRLPDEREVRRFFHNGASVAIVGGAISGNLERIDFDAPDLFPQWRGLVDDLVPGLFDRLAVVQTPRGGYHVYYRCDAPVEGNQKLARKRDNNTWSILIETRGEGGYTLAPPSEGYAVLQGDLCAISVIEYSERALLLDLARSFNAQQGPAVTGHERAGSGVDLRPGDDYNTRGDIAGLLRSHRWVEIGRRGDVTYWRRPDKQEGISATFNFVPGHLYVFSTNGYPFEAERAYTPFAAYTLLEHDGDFSAAARALGAVGYGQPHHTPPAPRSTGTEPALAGDGAHWMRQGQPSQGLQLYTLADLHALPPISWLVPDEIPAQAFTVLCGPSGAGKSFLGVDYGLRIAQAFPERTVVYIAAEGGLGYRLRAQAWLDHTRHDPPSNIRFILQAISLLDPHATDALISAIAPLNPALVIVDTLARCMIGGDENSAKDMGLFVYGCDRVKRETGAAVLAIHHSGKSGTGYRGSSALFAAADSWIDVANDDGLITVSCGKPKDWRPFEPRYLRLVERGESCVLIPARQVVTHDAKLTEGQRRTLEALSLGIFVEPGAKRSELISATGIAEVTMYRILSHLKKEGHISQAAKGDPYFITAKGQRELDAYHKRSEQKEAELSQLSPNSHQLSDSGSPTISHYHTPIYRGDSDSDSDSSDDSLVASPDPPAPGAPKLNLDYLRRMLALGDEKSLTAARTHCALRQIAYEDALVLLHASSSRKDPPPCPIF